MKIYNIFGPNLNMLGYRDKNIYGTLNFLQLNEEINKYASNKNHEYFSFQSNHEGEIIDYIHKIILTENQQVVIMLNLGAFSHYSHAIADALEIVCKKHLLIEVHLSNVKARESFRNFSVLERLKPRLYFGKGVNSYIEAIEGIGGKYE